MDQLMGRVSAPQHLEPLEKEGLLIGPADTLVVRLTDTSIAKSESRL